MFQNIQFLINLLGITRYIVQFTSAFIFILKWIVILSIIQVILENSFSIFNSNYSFNVFYFIIFRKQ